MPLRIPVSATAAEEIKQLALRFTKALETSTGQRIRGRKLYDAFVKPLGYDSFNEVTKLTGKTHSAFPMKKYLETIRRELRKHLPVEVVRRDIEFAIDAAANPGCVRVAIDGREVPDEALETLTGSVFYRSFREAAFKEGIARHIEWAESFDSPNRYTGERRTGPLVISLNYSRWPNENDPLFDWDRFDSFIRMVHLNACADNGVEIVICRITREGKTEVFTGFNKHQIPEWKSYIKIIDVGSAHKGFAHIFNSDIREELHDPTGNRVNTNAQAFILQTEDDFTHVTFGPSAEPKSFLSNTLNLLERASGLEVISLVRAMTSEEIDKWSPPERIAGEMLLKAMADVVDDFKTQGRGPLDFKLFYDWLGDIPGLLNESWVTGSTRDSLTFAYEEAKAVDIITSLRLNGLLPYTR